MSRISRARRQLQKSLWQYARDKGYVRAKRIVGRHIVAVGQEGAIMMMNKLMHPYTS